MKIVITGGEGHPFKQSAFDFWVNDFRRRIQRGTLLTHILYPAESPLAETIRVHCLKMAIQPVAFINSSADRNLWMLDMLNPDTDYVWPFMAGDDGKACALKAEELGIPVWYNFDREKLEHWIHPEYFTEENNDDEEDEAPEGAEAPVHDGGEVPAGNPPDGGVPAAVRTRILNIGTGLGGRRGGGQAEEAGTRGLQHIAPIDYGDVVNRVAEFNGWLPVQD